MQLFPSNILLKRIKNAILFLLVVLLLCDLTYSFLQHKARSLDGDIAGGVLPMENVKPVLSDPLAIKVITEGASYPNPNRFFAHWSFFTYFDYTPFWLQKLVSTLDSLYIASAVAKTIIQLLFLLVLAMYIVPSARPKWKELLLAMALIAPLFQTAGYQTHMGIILSSITYTFFYSLPLLFLLMFYLPFYRQSMYKSGFFKGKMLYFLLFPLAFVVTLSGVLNPVIVLIISLLYGIRLLFDESKTLNIESMRYAISSSIQRMPKPHLIFFTLISSCALYSLYVGRFDSNLSVVPRHTLLELYSKVPLGLYYILTQKLGFPLLLLSCIVHIIVIKKTMPAADSKQILSFFKWIGLFCVLYILLLPLGGNKVYRPYILRHDTIMPITVALVFIYGKSAFELLRHLGGKSKIYFVSFLVLVSFIFTIADEPEFNSNACERQAIEKIIASEDEVVQLDCNCPIIEWECEPLAEKTRRNGLMLQKYGVIKDVKLYYQK